MRLYGYNSVVERLRSYPKTIRHIYLQEGHREAAYIHRKAKQWEIPVYVVPGTKLLKLARNTNTQGILVDIEDFSYKSYDDLLEEAADKKRTLLFLDSLNDPQNLGAIMRSLACLGYFGIVLPTHDSVSVTETVLRVASGGDNHVPVSKVANLGQAIRQAKEAGFFIVGAVAESGKDLMQAEFPALVGLVLGSEQKGIREVNRRLLGEELTIPMQLDRLSFNVAHAAAILAYEITKQKKQKKK